MPPPPADQTPLSTRPSLVNRLSGTIEERPELRSLAGVGLFLFAFVAVLWVARAVFVPLTLALMLSFLLRPIVKGVRRVGLPESIGATFVMAGLLFGTGYGVVQLAEPASAWVDRLPKALRTVEAKVRPIQRNVQDVTQIAERVEKIAQVDKKRRVAPQVAVEKPSLLASAAEAAGKTIGGALVMTIGLFFMLIWGDGLIRRVISFLPDLGEQQTTTRVMDKIEKDMSGYLGTVTLINVLLGAAVGGAMYALEVPNPLLWGVLAALVNFVPYLGSLAGVAAVALASVVTFDDLSQAALPPLAYLALTTLEGQIVTPLVIGRRFRVSPLVVFIWLVFWAWLWGIPGALVAVPMLMLVKVTCEQSDTLAPVAELMSR